MLVIDHGFFYNGYLSAVGNIRQKTRNVKIPSKYQQVTHLIKQCGFFGFVPMYNRQGKPFLARLDIINKLYAQYYLVDGKLHKFKVILNGEEKERVNLTEVIEINPYYHDVIENKFFQSRKAFYMINFSISACHDKIDIAFEHHDPLYKIPQG